MTTLAPLPGISGNRVRNIPKTWDAQWFRRFVTDQLQPADYRNMGQLASTGVSSMAPNQTSTFTSMMQLGNSFLASGQSSCDLASNAYWDGTNYRYNTVASTSACLYVQNNNSNIGHQFYGSNPSSGGTGGSVITFTEKFRIGMSLAAGASVVSAYGPNLGSLVDITPDTGSFTVTLTGCTTAPTGTAFFTKMGNLVLVNLPGLTGTSNSNSCSYTFTNPTGMPIPTRQQTMALPFLDDNSLNVMGGVAYSSSGVFSFFKNGSPSGTSFTNGGTKGLSAPNCFVYAVNP